MSCTPSCFIDGSCASSASATIVGARQPPSPASSPDRHQDLGLCFICRKNLVPPDSRLVCSPSCAKKVPLELLDGRLDFKDRPQPGETWWLGTRVVQITTCDPYGRSFDYVVGEGDSKAFGHFGANEVDQGKARRIS